MERAKVDGVELEYETSGAGEPVLLIHGALIAGALAPLGDEPALAGHQLIRYHRRGVGGSTHTPGPVILADQAADAVGLLAALDVDRAHIVGHSYGGSIALQMAVDAPDTVQSLAALEPGLFGVPSAAAFFEGATPVLEAYGRGDREEAVLGFISLVSGLAPDAAARAVEATVPGGIDQAIKDADTFFSIELGALTEWVFGAEQAQSIGQPVLSVVGSDSHPMFVEGRGLLHSLFADVEDCTVDGAGHLLQMQQPRQVARALADFFGRHPIAAA